MPTLQARAYGFHGSISAALVEELAWKGGDSERRLLVGAGAVRMLLAGVQPPFERSDLDPRFDDRCTHAAMALVFLLAGEAQPDLAAAVGSDSANWHLAECAFARIGYLHQGLGGLRIFSYGDDEDSERRIKVPFPYMTPYLPPYLPAATQHNI